MIMKKTLISEVVDKTLYLSKCSILALTIGSMVVTPAYSKNFIESAMSKILKETMGTGTDAKAFKGATRGYVTGGNVSMRVPIWDHKVISFQPPSITAGCNGIDAFGGSFSFINADELVQLFRNIAANSVGLLFMLALETVSNEIGVNLKSFQNIIRDINNLVSDSCNAAKAVVSLADSALVNAGYKSEMNASLQAAAKDYGDHYDTLMNDLGKAATTLLGNEPTKTEEEGLYGNVVWQAMKANSTFGFTDIGSELVDGGNPDHMKELIMSITGSIIAEQRQKDPNGKTVTQSNNSKNNLTYSQPMDTLQHSLSFEDFIKGFDPATKKGLFTWKCDDQEKCIKPAKDTSTKFEGYSALLYKALCNADLKSECQTNSAIGKLATNNDDSGNALSSDEQSAIMSLPSSFRARITRLAILNGSALDHKTVDVKIVGTIIKNNIHAISATVVYDLVMGILEKIHNRIQTNPNGYADNFEKNLAERRKYLQSEFDTKLKTELGSLNEAVKNAEQDTEFMKKLIRVSDISNIYNIHVSDKSVLSSIPTVSKK